MYPLMAVCYFQFLRFMDVRWSQTHPLTDEEYLSRSARVKSISEYEIFFLAAKNWRVPDWQVEADFKAYLIHGRLPYYLKDHIRRIKTDR